MAAKAKYDPLEQEASPFTAVAVAVSDVPTLRAQPLVRVVAPATLPEGYTFEAEVSGKVVSVTVPEGGVREGESFTVAASDATPTPRRNIPVGEWRDGLFNCCAHGCCHPQLCLTYWCRPLALAQVMTRLHLNWIGSYVGPVRATATFKIVFVIVVLFHILASILFAVMTVGMSDNMPDLEQWNDESSPFDTLSFETPVAYQVAHSMIRVMALTFGIFLLVLTIRTRAYIRSKYAIPERNCVGCEDCCCAWWCGPCTVCQMARHTAEYHKYPASCCSETGLPSHVPDIV